MRDKRSRRAFVRKLAVAIGALAPLEFIARGHAQPSRPLKRIGVILVAASPESALAQQLRKGLTDAGYAEERDIIIDWRWAKGEFSRVPQLVNELIQLEVDVIVVETTPAALAVKRATSRTPVVMTLVSDPVGAGLVANLARPGGNITGFSLMTTDLTAKRLQLLKEAIPHLSRVAVLWSPDVPVHKKALEELKAVAPAMSIEVTTHGARTLEEITGALSAARSSRAHALYILISWTAPSSRVIDR